MGNICFNQKEKTLLNQESDGKLSDDVDLASEETVRENELFLNSLDLTTIKSSESEIVILDPTLKKLKFSFISEERKIKGDKHFFQEVFKSSNICEYSTFSNEINIIPEVNPLWWSFALAYNHHRNVTLDPDTLWMNILHGLSLIINEKPEQYRKIFVSHEDKKELSIRTREDENIYENFFEKIRPCLEKECQKDVISQISAQFSTTTLPLQIVQTGYILDGLKSYFSYTCTSRCGIRGVKFTGTNQDWLLLLKKVEKIESIIQCESWSKYIQGLVQIIKKFILTKQKRFDLIWWRKILDAQHYGTGSGAGIFYTGWILKLFYQTFDQSAIRNFPSQPFFKFPLKLMVGDMTTNLHVKGGIVGVHYNEKQQLFTPVSGLAVFSQNKTYNFD